jgi:hypothetical protein
LVSVTGAYIDPLPRRVEPRSYVRRAIDEDELLEVRDISLSSLSREQFEKLKSLAETSSEQLESDSGILDAYEYSSSVNLPDTDGN